MVSKGSQRRIIFNWGKNVPLRPRIFQQNEQFTECKFIFFRVAERYDQPLTMYGMQAGLSSRNRASR